MTAWWQTAKSNPVFRLVVAIAVLCIFVDQATKLWILHGLQLPERPFGHIDISPIFDLSYVENRGVSFGLLAGGMVSRVALSLLAIGVSAYIFKWAGTLDRRVAGIAGGLIAGGALGNVIDRISYGYVVDFIDVSALKFPWIFNVADTAINLGVACLIYDALFVAPKQAQAEKSPENNSVSFSEAEAEPRPSKLTNS
ncbi:signal peptidase II [Parvularcula sp. LCG005]|uniref:signal peptidase II n=1 Tax=Parvularcula sp. LCG005 TaxID=3078805 RepID=UPI0029436404|nr:signal peptidase II [Parvularcula sp. LCG005]WOI52819.1 signal peptidase II [Parvularcula sp. LCG005]